MSCPTSPYSDLTISISPGLAYLPGDFLMLYCDDCNYINGRVISYNSSTGELVISPTAFEGIGECCNWTINLSGIPGISGTSGVNGTSGSSGVNGTSGTTGTSGVNGTSGTSNTTYAETPSGLVNSSNTVYTLLNAPSNAAAAIILLDGVTQYNGVDYTVSGSTITFTSAPATGSSIFAYYNVVSGIGNGTSGTSGLTGTSGINGTSGTTGKSAYQSAIEGGYVGSELQFNTDLAKVSNKKWIDLATGFVSTPTLVSTVPLGVIYQYNYSTFTYYRYIATDLSEDSFYAEIGLTTLIATKQI